MRSEINEGINYAPYFTSEKTEAQKLGDLPKIKVSQWQNWEWNLGLLDNFNSYSYARFLQAYITWNPACC